MNLNSNPVPEDRCGVEFEWNDDVVLTSADIEVVEGEVTGVDFDDFAIRNQSCHRKTAPSKDRCKWHSRSYSEIESELLQKEEEWVDGIIPGVRFNNITETDLSEFVLPFSRFEGNINNIDFSRSVLAYSDFSGATIEGVNFTESHLEESLFIESKIDLNRDWGNRTQFRECMLNGVNFSGASFNEPVFSGSELDVNTTFDDDQKLSGADFSGCDLSDTDFSNTVIRKCDFKNTNLNDADFSKATLDKSSFINANCLGAVFREAYLEGAKMDSANLKSANFEKAEIDSVDFSDSQINHQTEFGTKTIYEIKKESETSFEKEAGRSLKAIWSYRALQRLYRENALLEGASHFYKKEKDLRRRQHRREITGDVNRNVLNEYPPQSAIPYRVGIIFNYIKAEASRLSIRYGESPFQLILFSGAIVFLFGIFYPVFGIKSDEGIIRYSLSTSNSGTYNIIQQLSYFADILHFSFFTFARTGIREAQPVGFSQFLAAVQSVAGAIVIALAVFVLTRRATS
ncbi:pentapeptide repeat-containing protein [Haloterrigena sp. SYSU A558-1]|uniref:Pentapeptide repeat-containing protein n=1 Tax=Haloterrigena gelatinilytica TaxID=2741724 RepID=A0ABX2LD34_9EURY|nr:pentapeptide repeat-containing protein [Haloterrigena gelatinilytica]NUC73616.1 pentapeptide repeat-containing protein [Haloterrigena gelatinilytica]